MKDLIVIAMTVAFFALAVGYVALCNRIIGPDEVEAEPAGATDADVGGDAGDRTTAEEVPA
jgi:hypothetical protein